MSNENENFWADADVISTYTREQAIDDGVLVDLSELGREAGFKFPVAVTARLWAEYIANESALEAPGQSEQGRAWDVLSMLMFAVRLGRASGSETYYKVIFTMPKARKGYKQQTVVLKSLVGPGDNMEPVITIMLTDED